MPDDHTPLFPCFCHTRSLNPPPTPQRNISDSSLVVRHAIQSKFGVWRDRLCPCFGSSTGWSRSESSALSRLHWNSLNTTRTDFASSYLHPSYGSAELHLWEEFGAAVCVLEEMVLVKWKRDGKGRLPCCAKRARGKAEKTS